MKKNIIYGILAAALVIAGGFLYGIYRPTLKADAIISDRDTYSYLNSVSTTTVDANPGVLHTLTVETAAASSVITLWDAKSSSSIQQTATGTITFGATSSSLSNSTGTLTAVINGLLVTSASLPNGSSSVNAATVLTTAITASSSVLGVTATSTNNVITLTSSLNNQYGNYPFTVFSALPQNGFTVNTAYTLASGLIGQITLPATTTYYTAPITATFDTAYNIGLTITQSVATSTFTVSWQ
jgi:hypothetical protein